MLLPVALALLSAVSLEVRFDGKPAAHFAVKYFDGRETTRATTDARGVAVLAVRNNSSEENLVRWNVWPGSSDYVFRNPHGEKGRWRIEAMHSAVWRQRTHPRPCDAWRAILDIPRGSVSMESAGDYDRWYASLTPRQLADCIEIARIETIVGSKAPWYLYEFKAQKSACIDGKFTGAELDWTAWYRGLLQEATHASPGMCVEDWERWWAAKGYPSIPKGESFVRKK